MRVAAGTRRPRPLDAGLERIREEFGVPAGFPPEVALAAIEAARRRAGRRARRPHRPPVRHARPGPARPTSTRRSPWSGPVDDIVLHYAIADVGFFVRPGDALDQEAWRRGVTVYMPDERARLYPAALSEGAASLLPDGPRPAVVFTVRVDPDGEVRSTASSGRSSTAGPSWPTTRSTAADAPARLRRAGAAHRRRRGTPRRATRRVPRAGARPRRRPLDAALRSPPAQRGRQRRHVAGHQPGRRRHAARRRHRAVPGDGRARRRRRSAGCGTRRAAFGLDWPAGQSLADFQRSLSTRRSDGRRRS